MFFFYTISHTNRWMETYTDAFLLYADVYKDSSKFFCLPQNYPYKYIFNTRSISTLIIIAVRLDILNCESVSGSRRFFPSRLQSCRDGVGPLAVRLLLGYATFNWLLLSAANPHQPPVHPDKRNTTGAPGSPNSAHVLCLTPQSQTLSIRLTPMDSLRKLHHSLRYRCHVLVTYDWLRQTESADILTLSSLILVEILENW